MKTAIVIEFADKWPTLQGQAVAAKGKGGTPRRVHRPVVFRFQPYLTDRLMSTGLRELALFPYCGKKLPWKRPSAELVPAEVHFPQRAGQSRPRPDGVLPSFVLATGTFRGPKTATRSFWTSHPLKWSWHLNALPRFGQPHASGMAGEVSEQGRMRSGAGREAQDLLCSPYKRKAALCLKRKDT